MALRKSKTRNIIYEHICDKPGITQNELKNSLEISQSTLSYHLILLEELTLIESRKKNRKRYYFATNYETMNNRIEKSKKPPLGEIMGSVKK
ncbi:MAG: helix-turn-helix domain-containing protein [Asgard group archaeon]|nr:helix-turn-helix domain-containing protein [Asgard group archaeon]